MTDERIEAALTTVAQLIDYYGDAYWPIFERLETELEMRHHRAEKLRRRLAKPERLRLISRSDRRSQRHGDAKTLFHKA